MLSEIEKLLVGASQMEKRKLEKCVVGVVIKGGEYHSGHPPPFCRGLSLQPNFQKGGGLTGPQLLEGGCWERGGLLGGGGGCNFHKKIN